jgi:hypothetical protein
MMIKSRKMRLTELVAHVGEKFILDAFGLG